MPFQIVRNDIAKMKAECLVCPTDPYYSGGGGADMSIHRAAGPRLDEACLSLPPLHTGEVAVTEGYALNIPYIIHTVGPVWIDGTHSEKEALFSCYQAVLKKALSLGVSSVAIPLISSGTYGFPKEHVLRIALDAINAFFFEYDLYDMTVYVVVYDKNSYAVSKKLVRDIMVLIDEQEISEHRYNNRSELFSGDYTTSQRPDQSDISYCKGPSVSPSIAYPPFFSDSDICFSVKEDSKENASAPLPPSQAAKPSPKKYSVKDEKKLSNLLNNLDEGFSGTLLRLIDEKGMTDVECYKKANIDKRLFSKIRSNPDYRPSKPTVLAFAVSLKLDLKETASLLERAGYAFSSSSKFDCIVKYFIQCGIYDILEINMVLFSFDQPCLGNVVA